MLNPVRVRFAPSPTGHFHIGGARTALYDFLLARQTGGQFILRIEDTDQKRCRPEYAAELLEGLRWLGLEWDEGPEVGGPYAPYNQAARKELYLEYARQLIDAGHAYRCFCSPERLQQIRQQQQQRKQNPRYDGTCRNLAPDESAARAARGEKFVVRFKSPTTGVTTVIDHLRREITVENESLDDYILVKSDGYALYHLAAVVDDHLMGITHVFRGSEWLSTLPLHALLFRAFGWKEPVWCHLSVFLNPTGRGKMSKRNLKSEQEIFVLNLRERGYLPEAVCNWIALMGASFGSDQEILTRADMIELFSVDRLTPAPARVNFEKLDYFNGAHIRRLEVADLAQRIKPYFDRAGLNADEPSLLRIAPIIQVRLTTLEDAVDMAGFFFRPPPQLDAAALSAAAAGLTPAQSQQALQAALHTLENLADFSPEAIEQPLRKLVIDLNLKAQQLFGLLRLAVTGQTVSPPLFECLAIIGREQTLTRVRNAIAALEGA